MAERFATLIASGALSVGDTLPSERELASAMGVSRETIRGALLILSTQGIVSVVQGARGYLTEFEVERALRDAIGGLTYSGTADIMRNLIARHLGLG